MGKTYRSAYQVNSQRREALDEDALESKLMSELDRGQVFSGWRNGQFVGRDPRGHNQIEVDECVNNSGQYDCPCSRCEEKYS